MKLKRCPFCNHHNLTLDITAYDYVVRCYECHASGPVCRDKEDAISLWNGQETRHGYTSLLNGQADNRNDPKEIAE